MKEQQHTEVSIYSRTGTRLNSASSGHTPWLRLVHGRVISMCTGMATVRRLNGTDISVMDSGDVTTVGGEDTGVIRDSHGRDA